MPWNPAAASQEYNDAQSGEKLPSFSTLISTPKLDLPTNNPNNTPNMPSHIKFTKVDTLPRYAWGAVYSHTDRSLNVYHGSGVETFDQGLVEGAWDGAFTDFSFHQSTVLCGTGFREADGELQFCSSTDRLAPLFSIQKDALIYISNSPIFAQSLSQTSYIPLYPYYNHDILATVREGLYCLDGTTPLQDGHKLHLHFSAIMAILPNGKIEYRKYDAGQEPESFASYRAIIQEAMNKVLQNGLDPARKHPLRSLATISTGYDSCATSALARDAGCERAATFYDSESDTPHADSGMENAKSLGMSCKEYDRWAFKKMPPLVEPEFCFMSGSSNAPTAAMESDLADCILIGGASGGETWGVQRTSFYNHLSTPWSRSVSGVSQLEFRLRVGYITMDPAVIAVRHNQRLAEIFSSDEMQEWSVPGNYNRPAARRIAEEAGIPREQFGMKKQMTSHSGLKTKEGFSAQGYTDYHAFIDQRIAQSNKLSWLYWRVHFAITFFLHYKLTSSRRKIRPSTPLQRKFPFILNSAPLRLTWRYVFAFQWAAEKLANRYQNLSMDD